MVGEEQIGEIDPWHLIREAYPHAMYLHGGRPYRVADIFKSSREVRLVPEHSRNLTDPHINKAVYTRRVRAVTKYPHLIIKMADFEVTERLVAVLEKTRSGDIVKQFTGSQGLSPHRLPTEGISIEVDPQLWSRIEMEIRNSNRPSVVHAIERLIRGLFPVISGPCDIMDFNTFSEARSGTISWCLYDQVRDGIDLTIGAYERVADLLAKALDRVASCKCEDDAGCFRCIRNPEEEEVSSKTDCVKVLSMLCQELMPEPSKEVFDVDLLEEDQPFDKCPNPECGAKVRYDDKFCNNCGERLGG
jgi:DEAD/DEAH box helicase domain-containing protein